MKNENDLTKIDNEIQNIQSNIISNFMICHKPEQFEKDLLASEIGKNECILLCFSDHTDLAGNQIQLGKGKLLSLEKIGTFIIKQIFDNDNKLVIVWEACYGFLLIKYLQKQLFEY